MDLLAKKEYGVAADTAAQLLKALEESMVDQGWHRAQCLEILPPEGATIVDRDEDLMAQRENELQVNVNGPQPRAQWEWSDGKGKSW